jgi:hypothetical protein
MAGLFQGEERGFRLNYMPKEFPLLDFAESKMPERRVSVPLPEKAVMEKDKDEQVAEQINREVEKFIDMVEEVKFVAKSYDYWDALSFTYSVLLKKIDPRIRRVVKDKVYDIVEIKDMADQVAEKLRQKKKEKSKQDFNVACNEVLDKRRINVGSISKEKEDFFRSQISIELNRRKLNK